MGGTGVIDNFLGVFTSYIDSGFGLLGGLGEVDRVGACPLAHDFQHDQQLKVGHRRLPHAFHHASGVIRGSGFLHLKPSLMCHTSHESF